MRTPANTMIHRRSALTRLGALSMVAATPFVASCAGPQVQNYAQEKPLLDLRTYFTGTIDAWGVFTDRSGQVVKRFTVVMDCSWNGDEGVLDEAFVYSDGTKQRRIWRLKAGPNGSYTGRADDVVGEAQGQTRGNAFYWTYTLSLPVDGKVYEVNFDDWMFCEAQPARPKAAVAVAAVRSRRLFMGTFG